jgi:hypothetical protein
LWADVVALVKKATRGRDLQLVNDGFCHPSVRGRPQAVIQTGVNPALDTGAGMESLASTKWKRFGNPRTRMITPATGLGEYVGVPEARPWD